MLICRRMVGCLHGGMVVGREMNSTSDQDQDIFIGLWKTPSLPSAWTRPAYSKNCLPTRGLL